MKWWHGHAIDRWCKRTTQEVIDEITDNPDLAAAFAAQWFDHGGRPSKASFAMHALITGSYLESGAWYPAGGGAAFAEHILPTITKAGGEARANTASRRWSSRMSGSSGYARQRERKSAPRP